MKYRFQPNKVQGIPPIEPPVESDEQIEAIKRISKKQIAELFEHEYRVVDVCVRFNNALKAKDRVLNFFEDNVEFIKLFQSSEVAKILNVSHQHYNRLLKEYLLTKNVK